MKYGILSDIHANLEALTVVLNHIDSQSIDQILCLGDVVGYGANPNECCQLLLERNPLLILGNHEHASIDLSESYLFSMHARESARWTYDYLDEEYKIIFRQLKDYRVLDDQSILMVHGSLTDRNGYIITSSQAEEQINIIKKTYPECLFTFFGHSHIKKIWGIAEVSEKIPNEYYLRENDYYLINPGSVGQPRDGDPRASYIIFDSDLNKITYNALEYDIITTQQKIISAGLPPYLSRRLERGN